VGFNIIGELGDEIENPRRNIPIAIAGGLGLIVLFYVGVAWVTAGNLTGDQMATSPVALLDAALLFLPDWFKHYLTVAALAGAVTSVNAVFLAVPRELVALAEAGYLPRALLRFDPRRQTFRNCLLVVLALGLLVVLTDRDVDHFGVLAVVGLMLLNAIISIGSLRLIRRFPEQVAAAKFPIRSWWLVPCALLTLAFSLAFSLLGMVEVPAVGGLTVLVVAGALILAWKKK
jgi:APA family basic amino acid/polyamine antiporter